MSASSLTSASAEAARATAREILHETRFRGPAVPRPLHGLLHAIGQALSGPSKLVNDGVVQLGRILPGGVATAWVVLALAVAGIGTLVVRRYSRRALIPSSDALTGAGASAERAAELERQADEAERQGRLADAVRLRFRAGLVRLSEQGAIPAPRSTPTRELSRMLRSPAFDALARRFEEIAYGAARAARSDVEEARRGWSALLKGGDRA